MIRTAIKQYLIVFITALLAVICLLVGAGMPAPTKASAIEGAIEGAIGGAGNEAGEGAIDYTALEYIKIPSGVDYTTQKVVIRFHCPSIRHIGDEDGYIEDFRDYISYMSFRQSMGAQVYFVDGVACSLEDGDYSDSSTSIYAQYYDIRYYDAENQYVYITFKNLAELVANDIGAYSNGVEIFDNTNETYTEKAKLAYLPDELPEDDETDKPGDENEPTEDDKTDKPAEGLFAWVEWWHILIAVYAVIGIVIGIIWTAKKQ